MIRKASLVLALFASMAMISAPSAKQAKADDFLRGAVGAALIMNGVGNIIQSTQPQYHVYPGGVYPGGFAPVPIHYQPAPIYYPPAPVYYQPAPSFIPGGGMPGVVPINYAPVQPQFFTTILP